MSSNGIDYLISDDHVASYVRILALCLCQQGELENRPKTSSSSAVTIFPWLNRFQTFRFLHTCCCLSYHNWQQLRCLRNWSDSIRFVFICSHNQLICHLKHLMYLFYLDNRAVLVRFSLSRSRNARLKQSFISARFVSFIVSCMSSFSCYYLFLLPFFLFFFTCVWVLFSTCWYSR